MFARDQPPGTSWVLDTGTNLIRYLSTIAAMTLLGMAACSQVESDDTVAAAAAAAQAAGVANEYVADQAAIDAAISAGQAADAVSPPSNSQTRARFTKAEFDNYVYGMTKAEIRAQFGSPLIVQDTDGGWYYPNLPIYDADAGIQVPVTVQFMGVGGLDDEVVAVEY